MLNTIRSCDSSAERSGGKRLSRKQTPCAFAKTSSAKFRRCGSRVPQQARNSPCRIKVTKTPARCRLTSGGASLRKSPTPSPRKVASMVRRASLSNHLALPLLRCRILPYPSERSSSCSSKRSWLTATSAAVSVRRIRGMSVIGNAPNATPKLTSESLKPPSGPTKRER